MVPTTQSDHLTEFQGEFLLSTDPDQLDLEIHDPEVYERLHSGPSQSGSSGEAK